MTVTYREFAEFLLQQGVFYYFRADQTVHSYVTADGKVRFWANWYGQQTSDYASLKTLMTKTTCRDLPTADDLANVGGTRVAVDREHLRHILDYLHDSEADHYDPETYPDDAKNHVYAHVLAIEEELKPRAERGAQ